MKIIPKLLLLVLLVSMFSYCNFPEKQEDVLPNVPENTEAISLLGKALHAPPADPKFLAQFELAKTKYQSSPQDADLLIWYGRRAGYLSLYRDAIQIFTEGINKFPDDARMYRHRGHRYISIREFDRAIRDLEKAATMIEGQEDEIEPDGIPNAKNIPVSTLHSNIWYHLGLAHYLKQDWEKALNAYTKCYRVAKNDDYRIASIHWQYMILSRTKKKEEAARLLERVSREMIIIENFDYHRLCLFYKGEMELEELLRPESSSASNDAVIYGIANWYAYNDNSQKAKETFRAMVKNKAGDPLALSLRRQN